MPIIEILSTSPVLAIIFSLLLGLIVGSFLNVVIYRLPVMMEREWTDQCCDFLEVDDEIKKAKKPHADIENFNLSKPNSHCPQCDHAITPLENIPVLSYLFLKGKCSQCKTSISLRYPAIEIVCSLLSCLVVMTFGITWIALALLVFTWSLIVLTMIDFDHQLLPDDITLPLLWLGLIVNSFGLLTSIENALWGAAIGYMTLWCVFWLFKLVTGKDGLGYGDFKLLAVLGAWMGWQALPVIIILSSMVGAVIGLSLMMFKGRDKNVPMPFGPFLAGAGFIYLFWGQQIVNFYLHNFL